MDSERPHNPFPLYAKDCPKVLLRSLKLFFRNNKIKAIIVPLYNSMILLNLFQTQTENAQKIVHCAHFFVHQQKDGVFYESW
jgi:hypothetical protein